MVAMARGWLLLMICCSVLGFMSFPSLSRASRLSTPLLRLSSEFQYNASKPGPIFRAELLHRDHIDSPLRPPTGTTAAQRLAAAAARSKARRQLLGAAGSEVVDLTPIFPGSTEYLITIHLGTPPQKFVVIVDSGSDLVWVQCLPCNPPHVCSPSPNPYFDRTASSSYAVVPCTSSQCDPNEFSSASCVESSRSCGISYVYQDGSGMAGELSTETIALSNSLNGVPWKTPSFLFGCMNNDTGPRGGAFLYVDGLVGFGRGPNSLPSQLTELTLNNVFSYCLVPFSAATTLTSSLLFGVTSPGPASYGLPLVYTPVLPYTDTFFWVNMTGISVNGTDLDIPRTLFEFNITTGEGGVIFDSGTTLLILQERILTAVVQTLQGLISYPEVNGTAYDSPLCYNLTGVKQPRFPSMSLHFGGINGTDVVDFPLTQPNIFVPAASDYLGNVVTAGVECLAMHTTGDDASSMLVGNIVQADHYVEYDVTNLQLGWTTSVDCSVPLLH